MQCTRGLVGMYLQEQGQEFLSSVQNMHFRRSLSKPQQSAASRLMCENYTGHLHCLWVVCSGAARSFPAMGGCPEIM